MLDILYSYDLRHISGPTKVVANLIKGLDRIGCEYVLNSRWPRQPYVFIPNGRANIVRVLQTSTSQKIAIGPNLFTFPNEIPGYLSWIIAKSNLYIQPSLLAANVWQLLGFNLLPIGIWPVGIDTEIFSPSTKKATRKVLVYHKERSKHELAEIEKVLSEMNLDYWTIIYGQYREAEYLQLLEQTSFILWHGGHESQGIALQEALSSNIPALVCDATSFYQMENFPNYPFIEILKRIEVTSAPYFDNRCGIKITDIAALPAALEQMMDLLGDFSPREYVLENLDLEIQARNLLKLMDKN